MAHAISLAGWLKHVKLLSLSLAVTFALCRGKASCLSLHGTGYSVVFDDGVRIACDQGNV